MKHIDDFILEQEYDEVFLIEEGFFSWLKKLGKKFWNWLTGKDFTGDDISWTSKPKLQTVKGDHIALNKTLSAKGLSEMFPQTAKLASNKELELTMIQGLNKEKVPISILTYTENADAIKRSLKKNVRKPENWVKYEKKINNIEKICMIASMEISKKCEETFDDVFDDYFSDQIDKELVKNYEIIFINQKFFNRKQLNLIDDTYKFIESDLPFIEGTEEWNEIPTDDRHKNDGKPNNDNTDETVNPTTDKTEIEKATDDLSGVKSDDHKGWIITRVTNQTDIKSEDVISRACFGDLHKNMSKDKVYVLLAVWNGEKEEKSHTAELAVFEFSQPTEEFISYMNDKEVKEMKFSRLSRMIVEVKKKFSLDNTVYISNIYISKMIDADTATYQEMFNQMFTSNHDAKKNMIEIAQDFGWTEDGNTKWNWVFDYNETTRDFLDANKIEEFAEDNKDTAVWIDAKNLKKVDVAEKDPTPDPSSAKVEYTAKGDKHKGLLEFKTGNDSIATADYTNDKKEIEDKLGIKVSKDYINYLISDFNMTEDDLSQEKFKDTFEKFIMPTIVQKFSEILKTKSKQLGKKMEKDGKGDGKPAVLPTMKI